MDNQITKDSRFLSKMPTSNTGGAGSAGEGTEGAKAKMREAEATLRKI